MLAPLLAVFGTALVLLFGAEHATATAPSFEPDPGSVGALSFYNASGVQITSGSVNDSPQAAYYAGSGGGIAAGDNKANIVYYTPQDGVATGSWTTGETWTSTQTFGAAVTYPGTLAGTTHAVVKGASTDGGLAVHISAFPSASTANPGIYQVRLYTTQAGGSGNATYYSADVLVSGSTWTQVYPAVVAGPTPTTTSVSPSPASPQTVGTNVTFTATVTPTAAGSVQFKDGGSNLGSPLTVSNGTAAFSTTSLTVATHSITAVFTPTDSAAFAGSTSTAISYVITSVPATTTTTSLAVTPTSPITVGTSSTMTATVTPNNAAGSVQFFDGASAIGTAVAVSGGTASKGNSFAANTHQLKAVFTPTDANAFTTSQSSVVSYTVNAAPATPTSTALAVAPDGPQTFGTTLNFTATVTPSNAVGSVQFLDGATVVDTGTVSSGSATGSSSTLNVGSHSLTAKFVPTVVADFGTSQSAVVTYSITKASTTTTLGISPSSPVTHGTSVTLTATLSPNSLSGAVQFFDGDSPLGSPAAVTSGSAHISTTALTVGSHSLSAQFTPASPNYGQSTSAASSFTVDPAPPGSTTTVLGVTPGGPVNVGATETLTATVTPSSATGTVQFRDGDTTIGSPVQVSGGTAQTTTTLPEGTHSVTAQFLSADTTTFANSTSAAVSYLVKPAPQATQTTIIVTPGGPVSFGTSVTIDATVSPSAAGIVNFLDGVTTLGTQPVSGGTASLSTLALGGGSHSLKATFVPTDPTDFVGSSSDPTALSVTAVETTTSLAVTPAGPVGAGQEVTLTATVTPSVAGGSVQFKNGATVLGSANVSGGTATLKTTALPTGTASLTASFTPTASADYGASGSDAVTLDVVDPPSIGSIKVNGETLEPGDALTPGQTLAIAAGGFQPGSEVKIEVHSTVVTLTTMSADADGNISATVTLPSSLEVGAHTLSLVGTTGTVSFEFRIVSAPGSASGGSGVGSSGGGDLANTGVDVISGVLIGILLVATGALALVLSARRRRPIRRAG